MTKGAGRTGQAQSDFRKCDYEIIAIGTLICFALITKLFVYLTYYYYYEVYVQLLCIFI